MEKRTLESIIIAKIKAEPFRAQRPYTMEVLNNTYHKLKEKEITFSMKNERFKFHLPTKILKYSDVVAQYIKDCEEQPDNDDVLREYVEDVFIDDAYEVTPEGTLISFDDNDDIYLSSCGAEGNARVFKEQGIVILEGCLRYELRGKDYKTVVDYTIDLDKFLERDYETEITADTKNWGADQFPVMVWVTSTLDGEGEYVVWDKKIDQELLKEYLIHQMLSKVFKCTYNPFYEKDGLVHVVHKGYRFKMAEYDTPEGFDMGYFRRNIMCSEQWASNQNLFKGRA